MTQISTNNALAKEILEAGDLVAIPTETVYGLAANAFNETAVKKIFALKKRPSFNPLIVHIAAIDDLNKIVRNVPPLAFELAEAFWPGSLTLLLEKTDAIPDIVSAGNKTVAVRIPNHPLALDLLKSIAFPLAAPSANPFMSISPTKPQHVKNYFDGELKLILDGGACENGIESTIIGFDKNQAVLFREGSLEISAIEKITGKLLIPKVKTPESVPAPGMLKRHYAPKTPLILTANYRNTVLRNSQKRVGVLTFAEVKNQSENMVYKFLSKNETLKEAASNFYATLIELDQLNLDVIVANYLPNIGLGKTINDRLERASAQ